VETIALSIAKDATDAMEILRQLRTKPGTSSSVLFKNPATNTHSTWHLCLPPHFNSALDLRFLQKQQMKNKKIVRTWKEWVQGGRFSFNEGSIIYDQDVSEIQTWGRKLEIINFYIVIRSARPVTIKTEKDENTGLKVVRRNPGMVTFGIYHSSSTVDKDMPREVTMTQDEFIEFAISGTLKN
jgi:hypothetical protein